MIGSSFLALPAVLVLMTVLNAIAPTLTEAHTLGDKLITEPMLAAQEPIPSPTTPPPQEQPPVPIPVQQPTAQYTDDLAFQPWWQEKVKSQVSTTHTRQYDACLFGDSISSGLGNTLGNGTFNFALGGMSTVSLIEQLKILTSAKVKCNTAIIAMGTNDADYSITNDNFVKNLKYSIALVKGMGATKVFLIPAFYSTLEASYNPRLAGSIARVEEINAFIRQVAAEQKTVLFEEDIQFLYQGQALKKTLTSDGVHLNTEGKKIYRQALLKLLNVNLKGCQ
jgi:lysophospholipase L1-like esterase